MPESANSAAAAAATAWKQNRATYMAEYGQLHPYFYPMRVWSDTRDMDEFVKHAKQSTATDNMLNSREEIIQIKMDNDSSSTPQHSWLRRLFTCCTSAPAPVQPYR